MIIAPEDAIDQMKEKVTRKMRNEEEEPLYVTDIRRFSFFTRITSQSLCLHKTLASIAITAENICQIFSVVYTFLPKQVV